MTDREQSLVSEAADSVMTWDGIRLAIADLIEFCREGREQDAYVSSDAWIERVARACWEADAAEYDMTARDWEHAKLAGLDSVYREAARVASMYMEDADCPLPDREVQS